MGGCGLATGRQVRSGQLVVVQAAVLAVVAAAFWGPALLAYLVAVPAAVVVVVALGRWRGRWLYAWLALGLGYAGRRRALDAARGDLLAALDPAGRLTVVESAQGPVGVLHDRAGLVAVLDVGDPSALLGDAAIRLPAPAELLASAQLTDAGGESENPVGTVQVLLQARPAPAPAVGNGVPAGSYRQLTGGAVPASLRALVALRVHAGPGSTPEELTPVLLGAVRRVGKRLSRAGLTARPLPVAGLAGALADLTPHSGGAPLRESWTGLVAGGRYQAVAFPTRWPALRTELVPRLLALPATEVTVSLTAQREHAAATRPPDLAIRLAATDPAGLVLAQRELARVFEMAGGTVQRADGRQLIGLAATLPLALPHPTGRPERRSTQPDGVDLELPPAGLVAGRNRHGQPVTLRLLRPEPTRAVLVGGGRAAATLVLRALALGAHVVVQTGRPESWDHLLRGVAGPADAVALVPPGAPFRPQPGTATAPQLVVLDVGPVSGEPVPAAPWRTILLVRDDVSTVDVDALGRADVVLLQPLRPAEAELVGGALGLGDGHAWLTRIRDDMVGLVSRRTVKWATLSATPVEQQVIGAVSRVLVG
jgi:type VII secretion protein EccE